MTDGEAGGLRYFDVDTKDELPPAPAGHRYLEFLGGARHLRCYVVPNDAARNEFMKSLTDLDECHEPVYRHAGLTVRQDASYALPSFFTVSFERQYRSLDVVDAANHAAAAALIREVRIGMRQELGIECIHIHYEEKADKSCNVHYWLMPVPSVAGDKSTAITRLDIRRYLGQFRFQEQRDAILESNARMRAYLATSGVSERIDGIAAAVSAIIPPLAHAEK